MFNSYHPYRFQKIGLIVLASLVCIVILFAQFFADTTRHLKAEVPIVNYSIYFNQNKTEDELKQLNLNEFNKQRKTFKETFLAFPWDDFENVTAKGHEAETLSYAESFIGELKHFLELEPLVPINEECKPPPLPSSDDVNCTLYPKAFSGVKRSEAIKVGVLLQFGFDVDVLEIHLNELFGVVDKFFIIESTHAHYGKLKKPLMWEHVKYQERFKKFPVIHFVIDDAQASIATDKKWSMESLQEQLRWFKFLEWNNATQYFSDDDIIGK